MAKKFARKAGALLLAVSMLASSMAISVNANYTMGTPVEDLPEKAPWQDNYIAPEGVDFSAETVSEMMQAIEDFDFEKFAEDNSDLPWLDELLVNEGVIPDNDANILFSRGSALYLKTHSPSSLGFVGSVYYADTLGQNSIFNVSLSSGTPSEDTSLRKNYPSHENQTFTSGNLSINQKKFITYGNTAVALYEFTNTSSEPITFTMTVKSPFTTGTEGDELVASHVACPTMVGTAGQNTVEAMSYVDVRLSGTEMSPSGNSLVREITVPAGETVDQKVVMGWLADEIPQSQEQYDEFKGYATNDEAFAAQVKMYNEWWADNIPYIDIPDENVKKVIYYRWWCNRFNLLEANIPGNDWQFPMNMEGVLGYNNGITVSVPWAMQDLKWLRDPSYAYGTWMAQGEYSGDDNYKNNPGRPGVWTWDMMQNTSQVGWQAYKIHGGGEEILEKFADYAKYDVLGTLNRFGGSGKYENLVIYNHGPITGNDGDCIGMHWNETSSDGNYARIDGTATTYANAVATAEMYAALGDTENQQLMEQKAQDIRDAVLENMWYDGTDFEEANGRGDGIADTNGEGSFLGLKVATGEYVPWRDNNFFVFNFRLVPSQLESEEYPDYAKYATQLYDYADPKYYPIFPFYTADQHSVLKRVESLAWDSDKVCCDHFAWCNFGNYLNTVRNSMRYYPVENIDADVYKTLFEWGAWLNCIEEGNTDYMDSVEFFWTEDFGMDGTTASTPTGEIIRSWIHHDTLGMMDFSVIEDIAGLQARADDKIELWPLGVDYDYFTVDNIRYHDQDLTIVWQDPAKEAHYEGIPTGFSLYIGNERVFTTNEMSHVIYDPATGKVELPDGDVDGAAGDNSNTEILYEIGTATPVATANETSLADNEKAVDMFNKAGIDLEHNSENLAMAEGTTITSTYIDSKSDIQNVADGSTVTGGGITFTDESKKTQHTALFSGTPNDTDYIQFDFDGQKTVDTVKLYFYNDRMVGGYCEPSMYIVQYKDPETGEYVVAPNQNKSPALPQANYNNDEFTEVTTDSIRVVFTHTLGYNTGIKEIQIYDNDVTVEEPVNQAPIVNTGTYDSINLDSTLTLMGSASDDGLPTGNLYPTWSIVDGPKGGEAKFSDANAFTTDVTFTEQGEYTLQLEVSDGELTSASTTTVEVNIVRDIYNAAFYATPSASYTNSDLGGLAAMNDGYEPASADDKSHGAWNDLGQEGQDQWVQYTWQEAVTIDSTELYFYNDNDSISEPKSYTIQYLDDEGNWVDVTGASGFGVTKGIFNRTTFDSITTTALRVNMTSDLGVGIIEWRVHSTDPMEVVNAYIDGVVATAGNNSNTAVTAANLVDKSGLVGSGFEAMHENTNWMAQWNTGYLGESSAPTDETAWVKFDLQKNYKIGEMGIWNYGFTPTSGLNNITVWYSKDDKNYEKLGDYSLDQAPASTGAAGEATIPAQIIDMAGTEARYVKITYNPVAGDGNFGSTYFGLSEVMFKKSTAVSSLKPAAVTTVVGVWPELPETVTANCDDGTVKELPVTWDESEIANKITVATQFSITGDVEGTSLKASCVISVVYDKSDLKQLLDTIESANVNEETYKGTEEQWTEFNAALENAKKVYANAFATQGDIDSAKSRLTDAFEALTPASDAVDKSELNEVILAAQDIENNDKYTPSSWEAFQNALEEAKAVNENSDATQEQVNEAVTNLEAAMNGLVVAGNKTLLEKTYEYALDLGTEGVTDSAVKAFENAKTAAKAVLDDPNATQEMIDTAWDNLLEGIWGLGLVQGDKTMLEQLIAKAETMVDNADKYVQTNWNQLVEALDKANEVMADGDAMEEDVQPAAEALLNAILAQRYQANKSILNELVNKAEAMDVSGYTFESVALFTTALQNAKVVLADATLSVDDQAVVDEAVNELNNAIENLSADSGEEVPGDENTPSGNEGEENTDSAQGNDSASDNTADNSSKTEGTQSNNNASASADNAQTGDNNMVLPVAVATAAAALVAASALVLVRRKRENG